MKLEWTGAGHQQLSVIWKSVEEFIIQALEHHGYKQVDTYYFWERIMRQEMQLWVLFDDEKIRGIMLTNIVEFGADKICEIPICAGGDAVDWTEFLTEVIEPWSKEQNVTRLELRMRPAGKRFLAKHDYYVSEVVLTKHLTRMEH